MGRTYRELLAVALLCGIALTGCSSSEAKPAAPSPSVSPPVTGTVEQIAAHLGCKPEIHTDAEQLREGRCGTGANVFSVTTFPAEKYKQAWLYEAGGWGGWYVVGPGWTVSASTKEAAVSRQKKLGGSLVDGSKVQKGTPPAT
ncbi:hypothetical protein [Cryptosporangium sp. NPDC048952]|uniref:hypothetical protein n=1 Tax=Cryptosporangium sp. NPDC048952 TaxID=3363961 RepID=UPI0037203250